MYYRNNSSVSSASVMSILAIAAAAGAALYFFMPSVLNKIRDTTDIGKKKGTPTASIRNDEERDENDNDGVLSDDSNMGAV